MRDNLYPDDHAEKGNRRPAEDDRLHRQVRPAAAAEGGGPGRRRVGGNVEAEIQKDPHCLSKAKLPPAARVAEVVGAIDQRPGHLRHPVHTGPRRIWCGVFTKKSAPLARWAKPLEVLSVFQRDAFKGYIYMEAKKPEAIERALNGMVNIRQAAYYCSRERVSKTFAQEVKSSDRGNQAGDLSVHHAKRVQGRLGGGGQLVGKRLGSAVKSGPALGLRQNDDFTPEGKAHPVGRCVLFRALFSEQEART